jgi:Type IV secretion system pilin
MRLIGSINRKIQLAAVAIVSVLSLGVMAPAIVSAQVTQQDINSSLCSGSNLTLTTTPGSCQATTASSTSALDNVIQTAVNVLSAIVGIIAVIMIIVGGFRYVTSGGNDTSVTSAKNTILYAIIGLVVVALAQVIVHFTLSKLTG